MGTLIKFEFRKILGNRAGMAACALALVMLAGIAFMNMLTGVTRDFQTGEYVEGAQAQQVLRNRAQSHAGVLDDARVAQDAAALDKANELAKAGGFFDIPSEEIIARYGLEAWQQSMAVLNDGYYMELGGTLDSANPRATSLQAGAEARVDAGLESGFMNYFPFTDAEKDYWREKESRIAWPAEYGSAIGWHNVLNWMSFSGLAIVAICIALSGAFAGEYQGGTAAVVLPTKRGKRVLPEAKVAAALLFTTLSWLACALVVTGIHIAFCGAYGWDLPVQVAYGFDNPYPLTVGQAVCALYALGYLIALGMAALTLLLSAKLRSSMPVAVIPMGIVFLGMFALFITPLAKVAALTPLSGLNYAFDRMVSYAVGTAVIDLPTALALLYGALLVICVPFAIRAFRRHQVA